MLFLAVNVRGQETFLDRFNNTSYSNNNGTQNFSTNWIEINDDNSPSNGDIRITNNQLRFRGLQNSAIWRRVNLTGATSVTFTMDYNAEDRGGESLGVYIYNFSNGNFNLIENLNSDNTGTVSYTLSSAEIASNPAIYFGSTSGNWGGGDRIFVDNVQFTATYGPRITIEDVTVNENDGTITFIATAGGAASGSYTVNYQTSNGTANSGSDYTATTGTMSFNGNIGDTETITIPILDDNILEDTETFFVQMIGSSNGSVDITDVATGTINDNDSIIMTNGNTTNQCDIVFLDPGGLNNYANNQNIIHTLCPEPGTDYVAVDFTSFDVQIGDFLYIYDGNSTGAALIGQYNNNNIPTSISASPGGSGCLTFRFTSNNFNNGEGFQADINCFQEGPRIVIDDVFVDEDAGTAVFTVTSTRARHGRNVFLLGFVNTQFTVNYTTTNGSALAGSDYTTTSGTLTFNGAIGNQRTISVPIANDGVPELAENFFVEFTSVNAPDAMVNIDDRGTGTINSQVLANDPLSIFKQFDGDFDYTTTGGSLRTESNNGNACAIQATSSNTLTSPIPNTGNVEAAYLYWAHSSAVRDDMVTFEGQNVNAGFVYQTTLTNRNFYGYVSDVTDIVNSIPDPSSNVYDFSDLTVDTSNTYCGSQTVLGGWALIIFYEDPSLPAVNINLYQGFDGLSNEGTNFTLDSFYAIAGVGAKATFLSWEGDETLDGNTGTNPEALSITNQAGTQFNLTGDGGNPGNNAYNSTIFDQTSGVNSSNIYGVDLDTYDISSFITPGDSQITANVDMGQDFVINMAVVIKVPSNLIAGTVFEDMNYPGGNGRNQTISSGVGSPGAIVELFESNGTFVERKTTDTNGNYAFGGMQDGDYLIKVVNSTVRSTRAGGLNCSECFPIQTFRSFGDANNITEVTSEVGGADPSASLDAALGVLTDAQSVSSATVESNGVTGIDFGFNFNTIVNTNENGQGSLEQFIVNSNNLDETGLDIEANMLFDPAAGEDLSVFMIPPSGDALGRTADANFVLGVFRINNVGVDFSDITGDTTIIDGRTQTAYSGDSNNGTIGAGGISVGVGATSLPNYQLPEIQIDKPAGEIFINQGTNGAIRNLSLITNDKSAIVIENGSLTIANNLIGINALGANGGAILTGVEIKDGITIIDGNYIATTVDNGVFIDGGSSTIIRNNHFTNNGNAACKPAIEVESGDGIVIQTNLIENSGGLGIDAENVSSPIIIDQNTVTTSGFMGGGCLAGILLGDDDAAVTGNIIHTNAGAGLELVGNGSGNLISQNSFYANGTAVPSLGIDLDQDGVTLNDNGDGDNGPNNLLNFPVIEFATISGSNLSIRGWARPGATIELFISDVSEGTASAGDNMIGYSSDYGEGQTYFATVIEGSASDLSAVVSNYTDMDGNSDTTNKFRFSIPIPAGIDIGDFITSTATVANSTSEFSPLSIIKVNTIITNRRITYRVKKN